MDGNLCTRKNGRGESAARSIRSISGPFAVFLKPDRPAVAASYGRQAAGGAARPGNQPRPRPFSSPNPFEFRAAAPTKRPMPFSLGTLTGLHAIPLTGEDHPLPRYGVLKNLYFPTLMFENNPNGKFMLSIAFSQSKYYVDNLSENVKRGIRQKLRRGEWSWYAPLGYVNNPTTRNIEPDPEYARFIASAFELYKTGDYTLLALQRRSKTWDCERVKGSPPLPRLRASRPQESSLLRNDEGERRAPSGSVRAARLARTSSTQCRK